MPETRLLVDPKLRAELEGDGLLDLDALMARDDLHVIKARLESRQTYRLETSTGRTLYLKLYRKVEPESRFSRLFAQRFDGRSVFASPQLVERAAEHTQAHLGQAQLVACGSNGRAKRPHGFTGATPGIRDAVELPVVPDACPREEAA